MDPGWALRSTDADLAARYRAEGLWNEETFRTGIAARVGVDSSLTFRVWSTTHPYVGTVGEVYEAARRLAAGLRARGVRAGDVVAFQLPNWVEAAVTFWGVTALGAVVVPIVHFYGPKEVGFILGQSGASTLVTADSFGHADYLAALDELAPRLDALERVAVVGDDAGSHTPFAALLEHDPIDVPADVDPDAPAVVGYTSGTTSDPKGVVHSHRSLLAEVRQLAPAQLRGDRPMLVGAPVAHAIGMLSGLLLPLERETAIHLTDVWDPGAILHAMVEADLTAGSGATFFAQSLVDHPDFGAEHRARMRHIGLGGSPVPGAFTARLESMGIRCARSYGSTEHPSTTGSLPDAPQHQRNRTDGRPMPGVEVRLADDGEILSRGPDLFAGYTDPALTAEAVDADGWYHTGDIGVLDDEGCLTITDRKKDLIIRGGTNVSPAEVEDVLARLDGIDEVAVVGAPDARLGERGCAFVRGRPVTLEEVQAHLDAAGLARQKWPEEVRHVDELPRTPSGKVQKYVLRARLRAEV